MAPGNNTSALQEQLNSLGARMDKQFDEVKALLSGFDERVRSLENREAGCQPVLTSRIDAAWRKLDEHDAQIKVFKDTLDEIVQTNKILKWLAGILTTVAIALIIALITGQIQFVVKP